MVRGGVSPAGHPAASSRCSGSSRRCVCPTPAGLWLPSAAAFAPPASLLPSREIDFAGRSTRNSCRR
jgi:hypothetical protein